MTALPVGRPCAPGRAQTGMARCAAAPQPRVPPRRRMTALRVGRSCVNHGLGLREFGARETDRSSFQLTSGDEGTLVRLEVWAKGHATVPRGCGHGLDVLVKQSKVAQQRWGRDEVARVRLSECTKRGRICVLSSKGLARFAHPHETTENEFVDRSCPPHRTQPEVGAQWTVKVWALWQQSRSLMATADTVPNGAACRRRELRVTDQ